MVCWNGKIHRMENSFFHVNYLGLGLDDQFIPQIPQNSMSHSLVQILVCACTICQYGQTLISCIIP